MKRLRGRSLDPGIKLSASGTPSPARGFGVTLGDDAGCLPMIILKCTGRRRCDLTVYSRQWELAKWSRSAFWWLTSQESLISTSSPYRACLFNPFEQSHALRTCFSHIPSGNLPVYVGRHSASSRWDKPEWCSVWSGFDVAINSIYVNVDPRSSCGRWRAKKLTSPSAPPGLIACSPRAIHLVRQRPRPPG